MHEARRRGIATTLSVVIGLIACTPAVQVKPSSPATVSIRPTTTSSAVAPTVTPIPTTPAPTTPPPPAALHFEQVATLPGFELSGVIDTSVGFVAFGCRLRGAGHPGCGEAVVVVSNDGRTWEPGVVQEPVDGSILAVAETPDGLVAVGSILPDEEIEHTARAMWRSVNGRTWRRFEVAIPREERFNGILTLDDRVVIPTVDVLDEWGIEDQVWGSTDGHRWTGSAAPVISKHAAAPGLIAIGSSCFDVCPDRVPTEVSRSADGLAWTAEKPGVTFGSSDGLEIEVWRGRAVAAGNASDAAAAPVRLWFDTPEGWTTADLVGSADMNPLIWLAADPWLVLVADANRRGELRGWGTADGSVWADVDLEGLRAGPMHAVARPDTVVVVGESAIWLASIEP